MNIHEYQAKALLKEYSVPLLQGGSAHTPEEAVAIAKSIGGNVWVLKAQIHAGGRGKGGGVKIVKSLEEVSQAATDLLGMQLITPQTGPAGKEVFLIFVEAGCAIERELYYSLLVDRDSSRIAIVASTEGGVDIEAVAEATPEKIAKVIIDPLTGPEAFYIQKLQKSLNLSGAAKKQFAQLVRGTYKAFLDLDASMIEINPLVITKSGDLCALDAKMSLDGNALYRHPALLELRDFSEEDPAEVAASAFDLNYIKLDGAIGCMVNGAGLAMATMDIIQYYGSAPANFLDVGGGATKERVTEAFKIILSDPQVKGVLVNIFGGIMKCDIIADGIISAVKTIDLNVPLVVRLEGTNVAAGKKLLEQSGLPIITADDLEDAAKKIVKAVTEATDVHTG